MNITFKSKFKRGDIVYATYNNILREYNIISLTVVFLNDWSVQSIRYEAYNPKYNSNNNTCHFYNYNRPFDYVFTTKEAARLAIKRQKIKDEIDKFRMCIIQSEEEYKKQCIAYNMLMPKGFEQYKITIQ